MNNWNTEQLLELLAEAGRIALSYYENPPTELKADFSVVTAADREIEDFLARSFDRPEEGSYLIGEETLGKRSRNYLTEALAGTAYVVDPIDGTAPYTSHLPVWGVSIGLLERGVLTEGAIYLPVDDEAVFTAAGQVWSCRNLQSGNREIIPFEFRRAPSGAAGHISVAQRCAKEAVMDFPNQAFCWSSCIGTFYAMLKGRVAAYFAHFKLWDVAGSWPILQAAGYRSFFLDGTEMSGDIGKGGSFILDFDSPRCWELRDFAVFAPDEEAARYVFDHVHRLEYHQ